MHRVVQSHLNNFKEEFDLMQDAPKAFEAFVSYIIIRQFFRDVVTPDDHVYSGSDPGIDSILFFVDGELVNSSEETTTVIQSKRRDSDVTIVFVQAKTGETWNKSDINTFESAILDFLQANSAYPQSDFLSERKDMFNIVVQNLGRIRNGKPRALIYFATTAPATEAIEINAAFSAIQRRVFQSGFFQPVEVIPLDRDKLVDLWIRSKGSVESNLQVFASAAFPKTEGIEESYVVTVSAKDFIEKVLVDDKGNRRINIFDENVRDFFGTENPVNAEIAKSLDGVDTKKRFGILNNGVTIISTDVRLQSNELFMRDFQIVNGCQTSNILFELQDKVTPEVTLMFKVVETTNSAIVDDIVRATNKQTQVDEHQFLASLDTVKAIERYFIARAEDEEHRLFFERRTNQFVTQSPPKMRVFDIKELARCVGAMFFDCPHLATRYPNHLTNDLKSKVFNTANREEIFYAAAFVLYRLQCHFGNSRVAPPYRKYRWFMLTAIKYKIGGNNLPLPTSRKIEDVCRRICEFAKRNDDDALAVWKEMGSFLDETVGGNRDKLKGERLVSDVRSRFASHLAS